MFLGRKGLESRMLGDNICWTEMKNKIQEISTWDSAKSAWPFVHPKLGKKKCMARQWSGGECIAVSTEALDMCRPWLWVMCVPDVLRTAKCLPRNQELWTSHKHTWDTGGTKGYSSQSFWLETVVLAAWKVQSFAIAFAPQTSLHRCYAHNPTALHLGIHHQQTCQNPSLRSQGEQ